MRLLVVIIIPYYFILVEIIEFDIDFLFGCYVNINVYCWFKSYAVWR